MAVVHPMRVCQLEKTIVLKGPCEVEAIFGGARLACYFCQQESRGVGAGLQGPDFLSLSLLLARSLFSLFLFPPPPLLNCLLTTPAVPTPSPPVKAFVVFCFLFFLS